MDGDLCRVAQLRANEIVTKLAHTRPDGTLCWTAYDELGVKSSYKAENIACGTFTGAATFNLWKEDGEKYDGQGHRRNMLSSSATKIGIAYTYVKDSDYKYYWVMELGK